MPRHAPSDQTIQPRDISFSGEAPLPRWWANGDPIATAFYNAMSAIFPQGERFFIESLRHYMALTPAELQPAIRAFTAQEAMHTREHHLFNEAMRQHGYDLTRIDALHRKLLDDTRKRGPVTQLLATVTLEHFTAMLSHALLSRPVHMRGAPQMTGELWRWHCMEEIEHKAVAFDAFMALTRPYMTPSRRWRMRCLVMMVVTARFVRLIGFSMADLLAQDGIAVKKRRWALFRFFMLDPGLLREVIGGYLRFYLPGFHPWDIDDRRLLASNRAHFEAEAQPA